MFTGLVETRGTLVRVTGDEDQATLVIRPHLQPFEVKVGASVAVDGACLTMESAVEGAMVVTAVRETLRRTTLGGARPGRLFNLERSLYLGQRLDGHLVLGHVDGVGRIVADKREGRSLVRSILLPGALLRFAAEKGSIALDGISLTIARSTAKSIDVAFVPHTLAMTTMPEKQVGDEVNVECDVLARYIHHLLQHRGETGPPGSAHDSLLGKMEAWGF
ncbi:MAG: riboflavin synthase [Spirochaetota bacterium]